MPATETQTTPEDSQASLQAALSEKAAEAAWEVASSLGVETLQEAVERLHFADKGQLVMYALGQLSLPTTTQSSSACDPWF